MELAEQGSRWVVHFSIGNEALNFPYRMDMLYDSKSEMVQVLGWPSGVCAGFCGENAKKCHPPPQKNPDFMDFLRFRRGASF